MSSDLYIFYFLFFPVTLARTLGTVSNKNSESKYLYHVSNFRRRAFNVSLLSTMLAVDFCVIPFIKLRTFPSVLDFCHCDKYLREII
jgi:hypothetical protein